MPDLKGLKIDALIPSRSGSKDLYGKSTVLVDSKPLIEYALEAASGAKSIRRAYIASDEKKLLNKYDGFRGIKAIELPEGLTGDDFFIKGFVGHAIAAMGADKPDILAVISPTAPLVSSLHIDDMVKFAGTLESFSSVASVVRTGSRYFGRIALNANNKVIRLVEGADNCPGSHRNAQTYELNRAIRLIDLKMLDRLDDLLLSDNTYAFEMDEYSSIDVNDQYDIVKAEATMVFLKKRLSWDERGRFNIQRFYIHDDPEMGILRNVFDSSAYERHLGRYRFFLEHIKDSDTVLDIACGSGYGSEILASKAALVHGVDTDSKTIEYAKRNHGLPNIRFEASSVEAFIPTCLYNKVISVETIEHLAEPDNFLQKVRKWLKPGGELWLTCPLSESGSARVDNPFHISEMTYEKLKSMMSRYFKEVAFFSLTGKDVFLVDTLKNKVSYVVAKGAGL